MHTRFKNGCFESIRSRSVWRLSIQYFPRRGNAEINIDLLLSQGGEARGQQHFLLLRKVKPFIKVQSSLSEKAQSLSPQVFERCQVMSSRIVGMLAEAFSVSFFPFSPAAIDG